ncbi:MAG: 6-pyruvoyl tetrahydropterin synthase family protein [Candidatus Competibacteraceae bacterium]
MFTIKKKFYFSASHIIEGLPASHPCGRLHGHNYIVELILAAELLDKTGFVVDYGDLQPFKDIIDNELDHRHLNDIVPGPASAENLAYYLFQRAKAIWPQTAAVCVSETPRTWAEYRP